MAKNAFHITGRGPKPPAPVITESALTEITVRVSATVKGALDRFIENDQGVGRRLDYEQVITAAIRDYIPGLCHPRTSYTGLSGAFPNVDGYEEQVPCRP